MSMAVVCAHLNVLGASVVATEAKSCSSCNVASPSAGFFLRQQRTTGARSGYRSLVCRASAGGQRRDNEKRRARNNPEPTPSKPDASANIDEKLNAINDDTEYDYEDGFVEADGNDFDGEEDEEEEDYEEVRIPLPADEAAVLDPAIARASYVGDKYEAGSEKGLGDRAADTAGAVADAAGVRRDDPNARRAQKTGKRVGDNLEDIGQEGQESAKAVSDSARDTADASGKRLQKAGRRVGQNLDEARKAGQSGEAGRAVDEIQEGVEEAGKTAQDLAGIAQENAEDAGKRLREAGSNIGDDLQNVGKEGQKVLERGAGAVSEQAREASKELGQQVEKTEQNAERAVRSSLRRAQESAERVQEPIEKAVNASINAAAAIGDEVFKLGDSIIEAVEEVTGMSGPDRSSFRPRQASKKSDDADDSEDLVGGKYRPAGKSVVRRYQGVKEDGDDSEEQSQGEGEGGAFSELTVLVAGATGATGRLIVQDLVGKGATVRALVRNVYRARNLKQLQGAELFEGDLYNYESVKEAVSGCNAVICAVGARGLPFDILQAYRTEYEGVLNLISATKNQGDVKKFVLMTTIGVNYLQVVPLLYWKRQAELFLQRSGLDYTIVRPAGLTGDRGSDRVELRPADSLFMGGISRKKVAEVCVTALVTPSATDKTVEVVGGSGRVRRSIADQFDSI
ncbi:hypothetical protein KC19_7G022400 [Ceratodon purpureus]|uniref:NAD(P)-binding domain-containing protein n=1 Tax=Ceratodon purpureus TaxID=3225 RepID=A0A8T0H3W1_CERPU|nr:hypothetical protein KC19_7G022400 [Ceratodon purpureus]